MFYRWKIRSIVYGNFLTFPLLRFTGIVTILVALDGLVCISLWIAGGDSEYMEDSVKDFSFTHSTFDLACISAVRCVILVACFYYLEQYSLLKVSVRQHDAIKGSNRMVKFCHVTILVVSGISAVYAVVKGSWIIRSILRKSWNSTDQEINMHISYKVLCIVSVIFPLCEIIFCTNEYLVPTKNDSYKEFTLTCELTRE